MLIISAVGSLPQQAQLPQLAASHSWLRNTRLPALWCREECRHVTPLCTEGHSRAHVLPAAFAIGIGVSSFTDRL